MILFFGKQRFTNLNGELRWIRHASVHFCAGFKFRTKNTHIRIWCPLYTKQHLRHCILRHAAAAERIDSTSRYCWHGSCRYSRQTPRDVLALAMPLPRIAFWKGTLFFLEVITKTPSVFLPRRHCCWRRCPPGTAIGKLKKVGDG